MSQLSEDQEFYVNNSFKNIQSDVYLKIEEMYDYTDIDGNTVTIIVFVSDGVGPEVELEQSTVEEALESNTLTSKKRSSSMHD